MEQALQRNDKKIGSFLVVNNNIICDTDIYLVKCSFFVNGDVAICLQTVE